MVYNKDEIRNQSKMLTSFMVKYKASARKAEVQQAVGHMPQMGTWEHARENRYREYVPPVTMKPVFNAYLTNASLYTVLWP